jgi:hypothetical protein
LFRHHCGRCVAGRGLAGDEKEIPVSKQTDSKPTKKEQAETLRQEYAKLQAEYEKHTAARAAAEREARKVKKAMDANIAEQAKLL